MNNNNKTESNRLIEQATTLIEAKNYDKAIEVLRKAIALYEHTNNTIEINEIRKKISEIYFLREQYTGNHGEKENDLKVKAEKLVREAKIFIEIEEFDDALNSYDKAIEVYKQSNNESEVQKVYELIEKCYENKKEFLKTQKSTEMKTEDMLAEQKEEPIGIKTENNHSSETKHMRALEDEYFQTQITEIVNNAENMAREYELNRTKAIKEGNLDFKSPYQDTIKIFNDIKEKLLARGWTDQIERYSNQIKICEKKYEQDLRLREIERQKREKDLEFLESLKVKEINGVDPEKLKIVEEKYLKELEDKEFQITISNLVNEAERKVRDYELKIKKGDFESEPVYAEVIAFYESIHDMLVKKGWRDQVGIYISNINLLKEKQLKDNKLRKIENQKKEKDRVYLEALKAKELGNIDAEKMKAVETSYRKQLEDKDFQDEITKMVEIAEKMEREYEIEKRKAIKNKNLLELDVPFPKIIEIYDKINKLLLERGWKSQADIYSASIKACDEKHTKDKMLRDIEAFKTQK